MAALSIAFILAVAAAPLFSNGGLSLHEAVEVMKADIRHTQVSAMNRGVSRSLQFINGNRSYTYDAAADGSGGNERDLSPLGGGVYINTTVSVTFNSLGEPLSPAQVTIISGEGSKTVSVAGYTGMTSAQ